ncbi:MAG: nuclear transport factor 2 family protein [Crocosphaera sp.]
MLNNQEIEQLIANYYAALRSLSATQWANVFAENATIEDPIGTPPITGGKEVFSQFYTNAINKNFKVIDIKEDNIFIKGNQAAVTWNFQGITHQDVNISFEGMTLFEFLDSGLISSFKVYWNALPIMPLFSSSNSGES